MSGVAEEPRGGFLAHGQGETEAAGRDLAALIEPGDLILVNGEVGAGKSTLVRAALRGLGVEGPIPSPTFTIGRLYDQPAQRMPVSHLDLYRLGDLAAEEPGLLSEYLGPDRAAFVEWPGGSDVQLRELSTRIGRVDIDHIDSESRRIRIEPPA